MKEEESRGAGRTAAAGTSTAASPISSAAPSPTWSLCPRCEPSSPGCGATSECGPQGTRLGSPRVSSSPPGGAEPSCCCLARRVLPLPCARLPGLSLRSPLHHYPRIGDAARVLLSSLAKPSVPPVLPSCFPSCLEEGGEGWEAAELGRQHWGGWPRSLQAWVLALCSLPASLGAASEARSAACTVVQSQSVSPIGWEQCAATGSAPCPKKGQRKAERGVLGAVGRV